MTKMKRVRVAVCVAAVALGSLALGGCFGGGGEGCPTVYNCHMK
jgi:hypothetical protein